jgi:enolase-phosphatase E1
VRAVLLDIEGTTTPIAFVHDVLFPFARAHLAGFLGDARNAAITAEVTTPEARARRRSACVADPAAVDELEPWKTSGQPSGYCTS